MPTYVTDRTKSDIDLIKRLHATGYSNMTSEEKTLWREGLKGAYNATDLNRVGNALNYIKGRLNAAGFNITWTAHEAWSNADIPTVIQMRDYIGYISDIRNAIAVYPTTPHAPTDMNGLTFVEANNIEKILRDCDALISLMLHSYYYSGEIYSVEV